MDTEKTKPLSITPIEDSILKKAADLWDECDKSTRKPPIEDTIAQDKDIKKKIAKPKGILDFRVTKSLCPPIKTEFTKKSAIKGKPEMCTLQSTSEDITEERNEILTEEVKKELWTVRIVPYQKKRKYTRKTEKEKCPQKRKSK